MCGALNVPLISWVLVIGGTRTVGRQIVSRLAVTGAQVCALARTQARLNCHDRSR
jgi:NAD(P)-dependent dehydrogenase (short-subunit alcohol dehydrogenase family)